MNGDFPLTYSDEPESTATPHNNIDELIMMSELELLKSATQMTAEESFDNYISIHRWMSDEYAQSLKEVWKASGSPYVNIVPGRRPRTTLEGVPQLSVGNGNVYQEIESSPTYIEEGRVPVDTLNIGSALNLEDDRLKNASPYTLFPQRVNFKALDNQFYDELAHAYQFGPEEYKYQYPEGTPFGEIPSDYSEWGQPTDKKSLEELAKRREELALQFALEELRHGQKKYDPPASGDDPTEEYKAHEIIEPQLRDLFKEKHATRENQPLTDLLGLISAASIAWGLPYLMLRPWMKERGGTPREQIKSKRRNP